MGRQSQVYVDPACNINYCSFYIKGLYELFGKNNVHFCSGGFESLKYTAETHYLAFRFGDRKYVIDCADSNAHYHDCFLEWADVYGKVNYNPEFIPGEWRSKVKRVGPNFGIACFGRNKYEALLHCLWKYPKAKKRLTNSFRCFLSPYLWLYKRSNLNWDSVAPSLVGSRTIFMVSRYWEGQDWANEARINFIRACKRLESEGLTKFIGGMIPDKKGTSCPKDIILEKELTFEEYNTGLRESLIAFNTPAYHKCHGWKLPEFFAQGKIILSTPFVNELPFDAEHKQHLYYTECDEQSIYNSIVEILNDLELQRTLEKGSREYWDLYANPKSCVQHFLSSEI